MSSVVPFNLTPIAKTAGRSVVISECTASAKRAFLPSSQSLPYYWDADVAGGIEKRDIIILLKYHGFTSTPSAIYGQSEEILRRLIEKRTLIENAEAVRDYFIVHAGVELQLFAAIESVCCNLGSKAECYLKVYHDPEISDEYLTLYVRNVEYPSNFMEVLDHIQEVSNAFRRESTGYVLVTTDFVTPVV